MAHGFSVQGGLGAGGSAILHESSDHSVLVPDTELLFTAQFHRAGPDLVLTGRDGAHHLVPGYFASEHHPALVAPNGAHLSPDTVDLLAGSPTPGHYAQAQPTAPPDAIGKIEKVVGDVSVVRNGVTVALHVGDAVFKSDVVQTGASSACGISFPDGTALNLVANTRMALNDYAYDANSNSNGALFSLVEGTFAFVAGKVAHSGDMKIATPVATMGIRGTTGVVQEQSNPPATITANAGDHTYSFAVVPDIGTGITGMWDVYLTDANGIIQRDANGNPIVLVTVSQSGYVTYVTPQGVGQAPLVTTEPVTNSQYAFEQQMLSDLFRTLNPSNLNNNNNGGSSTQPPPFNLPNPIPQLFEDTGKPFTINFINGSNTPTPTIVDIVVGTGPLTVVIWTAGGSGPWSSGPSWLGGAPPTSPQEVEILNPVKVTTDGADSAAGLVVAAGATLNIVSGTSFTIYDFIQGAGTIALNSSGSDPTLFIHGAVSLVGGGTIKMLGPVGEDFILGVPGTGALLINVDYTIKGTGTIGGGDGNLTFENFGIVNANDGVLAINTGNQVYNDGLMEATADPLAATSGALQIKDSVINAGTVQADGLVAAVALSGATFDNLFSVIAKNHGIITFTNVAVTNETVSATDPTGGTINANGGAITFDGGSIANGNILEATNHGVLLLDNLTVTNSSAATASVDVTSALELVSAAILGGTIENAGEVIVTNGASVLHGDSVTNSGTMTVEAGASLTLEGDTTLINQAGGHITADGGTVSIEIDTDTNVNSGTIEAVNGGEVDFYINVEGGSNHGLIEAGAGGTVHFFQVHQGGGGGGGQGGNYGTMEAADGGALIFDGGLDNFDLLEAVNGGSVDLSNGAHNHAGGTILATGGGIVTIDSGLKNEATAIVKADDPGSQVDINGFVDNLGTIQATGTNAQVDLANGSVDNELGGLIEADTGGTVTFDSTLDGAINAGTIKAGAGGTIVIDGFSGGNGLTNGDGVGDVGTIEAVGTGAKVELAGATIIGGKLGTMGGGIFETVSGTSTLMNVILTGGTFKVDSGTILDLNGGSNSVAAYIDSTVTLKGPGTVEMDFTSTSIRGGNSNGTLNNQTTIEGRGTIGTGDTPLPGVLTLVNSGTIEAVGGEFDINTGTRNAATTTNSGTLEANGANAVLLIHHTNMNNAGGTIAALNGLDAVAATASVVELLDDVIVGGTLKTSNLGTIETITDHGTASTTVFDGVINQGYVLVNANTTLVLRDTIDNTGGKIALAQSGSSNLQIDGTVTLKNGEVELNTSIDEITALASGAALDNTANIHGQGQIGTGDDKLTLDNLSGGIINATGFFIINTGANIVQNSGLLEAIVNGGTLAIESAVDNTGTIKADGNGASVTLAAGVANYGTIEAFSGGIVNVEAYSGTIDNYGTMKADGGQVQLYDQVLSTSVTNHSGGVIEALDHGTVTIAVVGGMFNLGGGLIEADGGSVTFGTPSLTNAANATIEALDGGILSFTAATTAFHNAGTVSLDDGAIALEFDMTLDGGGVVTLSDDSRNAIDSLGAAETLTNVDNTISGAGTIGDAHLTLVNDQHGVIDADDVNALILNTGANTITNAGLLEATNGATLEIKSSVANGGGTITASGAGSVVELFGVTVTDGTLESSGGGIIETASGTSTLSGVTINDGSILEASNGTVIDLENTTTLNGTVTFEGGGTFVLDPGVASIVGAAGVTGGTLDIAAGATLTGSGDIGNAGSPSPTSLTLDNAGTIDAHGKGAEIDIDTGNTVTNTGTLKATHGGMLVVDDDVTNTGGTIAAHGSGSVVELDGITVTSGTLVTDTCGVIETGLGASTLDGVTIAAGSAIEVISGTTLTLHDTTDRGGTLTVDGGATLAIDSTNPGNVTTLAGVTVTNDGTIQIDDPLPSATLVLDDDTTVSGGIVSIGSAGTLTIETGASGSGATLDNVTAHDSGAILVNSGATLTLDDGTTIDNGGESGTLTVASVSTLAIHSGGATLDGLDVTDSGAIVVGDVCSGATLTLDDGTTITGGGVGTLTVSSGSTLSIESGGATLDGINVTDSGAIVVGDVCSGATLTLDDGTTITGGGVGTLTVNSGSTLAIDSGGATLACLTVDNCGGDITVAADTTLTLDRVTVHGGAVDGTDAACSGSIVASTIDVTGDSTFCNVDVSHGDLTVEKGATLTLDGGTVSDVTLQTDGDGLIETTGNSTLLNVTIADGSTLEAGTGATFLLEGTTTVSDPVTFKGCGTFELSGNGAKIVGAGDNADLHNYATIAGAGTIGSADLSVTNECSGIIDATGCLTINLSSNILTNDGTMEATCGGELTLLSPVLNSGLIAAYAGSTVYIGNEVTNSDCGQVIASGHCAVVDLVNAVIGGGTVESNCGGLIQTVAGLDDTPTQSIFDDVTIGCGSDVKVVDHTTLVLEGGTTMSDGTLSIESSGGVEIVNGGGSGGATLTNVTLYNCGEVTVDNDTTLTLSGTTVHGGAIDGTDASGCIVASTIDVTGDSTFCGVHLSGGDLTVEGNVTLTLSGDRVSDVAINGTDASGCIVASTIDVTGDSTFCDVNLSGGNLTVEGDVTLKLSGVTVDGTTIDDYTDSGTTVVPGTIEITGDSAINNSTVEGEGGPADKGSPGVITVDCHTTLTLDNTTLEDLQVTNNGALHVAGTTTTTLDDVGVDNANGCIEVDVTNSGATLTLDDDSTITGGKLKIGLSGALDIATGNGGSGHGATLDGVAVTNNNGNIDVDVTDSGAILTLDDDSTITGGNLTTGTYGELHIATGADGCGHGATLDDVNVIDNGDINLDSGAILTLDDGTKITGTATGTLTIAAGTTVDIEHGSGGGPNHGAVFDGLTVNDNGGALDIGDVNSGAILTLEDGTTITGGGTGTMTIHANNAVDVEKGANDGINGATLDGLHVTDCGALDVGDTPDASGAVLTLDDGTTVTGGGTGQLTINFGNTLDIEKGSNDGINGATLDGVIVQDNGTIDIGHAGTGAVLTLDDGTTINGGGTAALTIHAGSTLDVENGPNGGGATLDDVHVTDNGAFDIGDAASGAILTLQDDATITGGGIGTMIIHANNTVDVETGTNGGATLDGVSVTDNGALDIGDDLASGAILTLDDDTGISGCGAMTINAGNTLDVTGGNTTINLGGTITNNGTLEASGGGTLDIVSHIDNGSGALLATSGGKLDIESAICGGTATIHGATLEFDASSNVHVTFDNGSVDSPTYGMLVLGDPGDFHGIISDFTGTCADSAHSDVIDLQGIDYTSETFHECYDAATGVLTVTDGTNTAHLNFDDFTGTFKFASDDNGGTYVYDPPVGGSKDAPVTATAAPVNDHATAPANQNGTGHAASPANEAGFLGNQDAAAASTSHDDAAAPPANQLALAVDTVTAPPSATSAHGSDLVAFDNDHLAVPTAGPAPGSVHSGAVTMTVTAVAPPIAVVLPGAPVLDSEHLTDSTIVDGSGTPHDEVAPPTVPAAPANEHTVAPATVTAPPPAPSPTLASASLGGLGNDSFAFHPNLGGDAAQNTDAHTSELAHSAVQIGGPASGSIAPEFHQEFAFDAIHQDTAALAATVDQFHQMAASSTLLH